MTDELSAVKGLLSFRASYETNIHYREVCRRALNTIKALEQQIKELKGDEMGARK